MEQRIDAHQRVMIARARFFIKCPKIDDTFRRSLDK